MVSRHATDYPYKGQCTTGGPALPGACCTSSGFFLYVLQNKIKEALCDWSLPIVQFIYPSQVFVKKEYPIRLKDSGVFFLAERKYGKNHKEIGSHLNPSSCFIFSNSSFMASAKAWLIGNPSLAKSMAGLTRSFQVNLP